MKSMMVRMKWTEEQRSELRGLIADTWYNPTLIEKNLRKFVLQSPPMSHQFISEKTSPPRSNVDMYLIFIIYDATYNLLYFQFVPCAYADFQWKLRMILAWLDWAELIWYSIFHAATSTWLDR